MLRAVLDTNVIVSGILSRTGAPYELLNTWRERRFLLLSSQTIIEEVGVVLHYPRIREKYSLSDEEIVQTITLLEHDALLIAGESNVAGSVPDDPKDEMFLACALDGQADVIVSGDHHLLDLKIYRDIPIMTARQFLDQLMQEQSRGKYLSNSAPFSEGSHSSQGENQSFVAVRWRSSVVSLTYRLLRHWRTRRSPVESMVENQMIYRRTALRACPDEGRSLS